MYLPSDDQPVAVLRAERPSEPERKKMDEWCACAAARAEQEILKEHKGQPSEEFRVRVRAVTRDVLRAIFVGGNPAIWKFDEAATCGQVAESVVRTVKYRLSFWTDPDNTVIVWRDGGWKPVSTKSMVPKLGPDGKPVLKKNGKPKLEREIPRLELRPHQIDRRAVPINEAGDMPDQKGRDAHAATLRRELRQLLRDAIDALHDRNERLILRNELRETPFSQKTLRRHVRGANGNLISQPRIAQMKRKALGELRMILQKRRVNCTLAS